MKKLLILLFCFSLIWLSYSLGFIVGLLSTPKTHENSPNLNESVSSDSLLDFVPDTPEKVELLVMSIYRAEGGEKTKYPFGIKSLKYENRTDRNLSKYDWAKMICRNTVVNNLARWEKTGDKVTYLQFLANRYCPINGDLTEDEHRLNGNWLRLVTYFLTKHKNTL